MAKSFSAKFNKSGKDLYNIALEAIINIGYNIDSEDNKKLIIFAKTSMSWKTFGQDLEIAIKGSNIKLQTRSGQLTDYGEGKEISEKLFDEIKKLSKSVKKIKPVKKEKIEQSIQKTKKSSQSKMIWWISGAVGFVILLMVIGSGGNNSGSDANSQTYSFSSKRVVCTGNGCVIKCSYSGSSLDYWTKFYDDGYHVRLPRWGCPLRLDKNGFPAG